ncbi:hypothetical protein OPU71_01510 [Niveibacterium sp. 24ML]|uniref:hypothetical protein n=1 Tax=Niveibacterium sp. 24ML TaxID=2985512 RepID=UPI00226DDF3F|nr:hypothetical protein [Niveibacterium sp. 24ML]MCX9154796.1 hypothetical protein [Niveibacterium sp. 24ML]
MRDLDTDENYGLGFVRATGEREQWKFEGTSDLLLDSHILKRSFTQVQSGDETLLVGRQLLRGKMPNGGVTELPGIRILRIAPQFVISAQMNFQPMTGGLSVKAYQQRLDAVSQELIDIVKSIRPTPGQPGPTVRQR